MTEALWLTVMGNYPTDSERKGDNSPMYYVSWSDIVGTNSSEVGYEANGVTYYKNGFCYRLSELIGGSKKFCLPADEEWESIAKQECKIEQRGSNIEKNIEISTSGVIHEWCSDACNWGKCENCGFEGSDKRKYRDCRVQRSICYNWYVEYGEKPYYIYGYNNCRPDTRGWGYGFRLCLYEKDLID